MKAIVAYGAKDYRFCEIDTPKAGKGEILIKIEAAGICASDRAVYMGGDPWGGIDSPRTPGHEFVGIVEEVGPGAEEKALFRETELPQSVSCRAESVITVNEVFIIFVTMKTDFLRVALQNT